MARRATVIRIAARRRAMPVLAVVLIVVIGIPVGAREDSTPERGQLGEFMWGLAGQESGWDWRARNKASGAYGRYQIMPFNWPAWSRLYLGEGWWDQNPWNQERVARAKIAALYVWLGSWQRVAYWWLTGKREKDRKTWSPTATRYVENVMALMKRAPRDGSGMPRKPRYARHDIDAGDWRLLAEGARLRVRPAGRRLGPVREAIVVKVRDLKWGPTGTVLWMRVQTVGGRTGWIRSRVTTPARKPRNAAAWGRDPGPPRVDDRRTDRDRDRGRARPRPR